MERHVVEGGEGKDDTGVAYHDWVNPCSLKSAGLLLHTYDVRIEEKYVL